VTASVFPDRKIRLAVSRTVHGDGRSVHALIPKDMKEVTEKSCSSLRSTSTSIYGLKNTKKYEMKKSNAGFLFPSLEARPEALSWCPAV